MKITRDLIMAGSSTTHTGAWNKKQLEVLGISWPPKHGWLHGMIGSEISDEKYQKFLSLQRIRKGNHQPMAARDQEDRLCQTLRLTREAHSLALSVHSARDQPGNHLTETLRLLSEAIHALSSCEQWTATKP